MALNVGDIVRGKPDSPCWRITLARVIGVFSERNVGIEIIELTTGCEVGERYEVGSEYLELVQAAAEQPSQTEKTAVLPQKASLVCFLSSMAPKQDIRVFGDISCKREIIFFGPIGNGRIKLLEPYYNREIELFWSNNDIIWIRMVPHLKERRDSHE